MNSVRFGGKKKKKLLSAKSEGISLLGISRRSRKFLLAFKAKSQVRKCNFVLCFHFILVGKPK